MCAYVHAHAVRGHLGSRRRSGTLSQTAAASPVLVPFFAPALLSPQKCGGGVASTTEVVLPTSTH